MKRLRDIWKNWAVTHPEVQAAWIAGVFVLISAVIGGVFLLASQRSDNQTPTPPSGITTQGQGLATAVTTTPMSLPNSPGSTITPWHNLISHGSFVQVNGGNARCQVQSSSGRFEFTNDTHENFQACRLAGLTSRSFQNLGYLEAQLRAGSNSSPAFARVHLRMDARVGNTSIQVLCGIERRNAEYLALMTTIVDNPDPSASCENDFDPNGMMDERCESRSEFKQLISSVGYQFRLEANPVSHGFTCTVERVNSTSELAARASITLGPEQGLGEISLNEASFTPGLEASYDPGATDFFVVEALAEGDS